MKSIRASQCSCGGVEERNGCVAVSQQQDRARCRPSTTASAPRATRRLDDVEVGGSRAGIRDEAVHEFVVDHVVDALARSAASGTSTSTPYCGQAGSGNTVAGHRVAGARAGRPAVAARRRRLCRTRSTRSIERNGDRWPVIVVGDEVQSCSSPARSASTPARSRAAAASPEHGDPARPSRRRAEAPRSRRSRPTRASTGALAWPPTRACTTLVEQPVVDGSLDTQLMPPRARCGSAPAHVTRPRRMPGGCPRAAWMSSLLVPAATIGHTIASLPTMKSTTTGASLIEIAFSIVVVDVGLRLAAQPDAAERFGELHEVGDAVLVGAEIGLAVALVVEQRLPLADHAEVAVVDHGDLDRDALDRAGGEFLIRHLEAAVAVDRPDQRVRACRPSRPSRPARRSPSSRRRRS